MDRMHPAYTAVTRALGSGRRRWCPTAFVWQYCLRRLGSSLQGNFRNRAIVV